jgi:glyoxylase-like metal-dependent hydrolase (beta-lactamase superfamily II)
MWGTAIEGGLRFPNAAYYSGAAEWDFWNDPDIFNKMPKDMHPFVTGAQTNYGAVKDRVTMLKPGDEVVTGIRALDTAGHTPGHTSFEVAGGEGLIIVGDVLPIPGVYFPHPEWKFGFDAIHEMAIAARQRWSASIGPIRASASPKRKTPPTATRPLERSNDTLEGGRYRRPFVIRRVRRARRAGCARSARSRRSLRVTSPGTRR